MMDRKTLCAWQQYLLDLSDAQNHAIDLLSTLTDDDTSSAQLRVAQVRCAEVVTRAQRVLASATVLSLRAQDAFESVVLAQEAK